jgi:purine-binding chemotaxis protein CheW
MPLNAPQRPLPDPQRSLVGFTVGDVQYAVSISNVREIVIPLGLTVLPHMPAGLAGVADHRGGVVPIVDLRVRFGLPRLDTLTKKTKWILVDCGKRTVGLAVDEVAGVFRVMASDVRPAPELGGGEQVRGIEGVANRGHGLVFILDVTRFEALTEPLARAGLLSPASGAEEISG